MEVTALVCTSPCTHRQMMASKVKHQNSSYNVAIFHICGCLLMLGVWLSLFLTLLFLFSSSLFSTSPFPSSPPAPWHSAFQTMASLYFLCIHSSKLTRLCTPWGEDLELNDGSAAWPYHMSSTLHDILGKTKAEGPSSARQQSSDDGELKRKGADPRGGCTFETRVLWAKTLPS